MRVHHPGCVHNTTRPFLDQYYRRGDTLLFYSYSPSHMVNALTFRRLLPPQLSSGLLLLHVQLSINKAGC